MGGSQVKVHFDMELYSRYSLMATDTINSSPLRSQDLLLLDKYTNGAYYFDCSDYAKLKEPARDLRSFTRNHDYSNAIRISFSCNSRLLRSYIRLKKNRPYNHWLKSQGHYLSCFSTSNGRSQFGSLAT